MVHAVIGLHAAMAINGASGIGGFRDANTCPLGIGFSPTNA